MTATKNVSKAQPTFTSAAIDTSGRERRVADRLAPAAFSTDNKAEAQ